MSLKAWNLSPVIAVLCVFIGGACGSVLRWWGSLATVSLEHSTHCRNWCHMLLGEGGVNLDTWILNLLSVFLLAYLTARLTSSPQRHRSQFIKLLVGTGFCGGLGTYGGPVWQVVGYHGFDPVFLAELVGLFAAGLPVGLFGMFLGARRSRVEVSRVEVSRAGKSGGLR